MSVPEIVADIHAGVTKASVADFRRKYPPAACLSSLPHSFGFNNLKFC
jgi:hypothetical protein